MLVSCDCGARYRYDEQKFGDASQKKVRCPKCKQVLTLTNPALVSTRMHEVASGRMPKKLQTPRFSLSIWHGVSAGRVLPIDKPKVTIGRIGSDIEIDDPEASRMHAELEVDGDTLILRDLNSSNGTFVKGEKITSVRLQDQSEFQIGHTLFTVQKVLLTFD